MRIIHINNAPDLKASTATALCGRELLSAGKYPNDRDDWSTIQGYHRNPHWSDWCEMCIQDPLVDLMRLKDVL